MKIWIFAGPFPASQVYLTSLVPQLTSRGHQVKIYSSAQFTPNFQVINFCSEGLVAKQDKSPIDRFNFKTRWKEFWLEQLLDELYTDSPDLILCYFEQLGAWCAKELKIPVWELSNASLSRITNNKYLWLSIRINCFYFGQMHSPVVPARAIPVDRILTYSPFYRFLSEVLPPRTIYPEVKLEWVRPYGFGASLKDEEVVVANNLGRKLDVFARQEQLEWVDFPTEPYQTGKILGTSGESAYLEDALSLGVDKINVFPHLDDPETCLNAGVVENLGLGTNFGTIEKMGSYASSWFAGRDRKYQDHAWEVEDPPYLHDLLEKI